ncbi:MAG: endolytic transglycosylase MltG [Clostridia bacterium]|nr:endolytic transglycosylase MltG [Clostridia bacterium]
MADNNGKSRADELFDMLNELNSDTPEQKVSKDRQEIDSHVDEILEILSKNEPAPEYKQERNAVYYGDGEIPVSIFDHLSDKPKAETAPTPAPIPTPVQKPVNEPAPAPKPEPVPEKEEVIEEPSVISSHFSSAEDYENIPLPEAETEEEVEEEESKLDKVGNVISRISFLPKALIYILTVVIVSAYLSYYIITIGNDVFALVTDSKEVTITLEEGVTDEEVAKMLQDEGIIEYGWVYKLYMNYRGSDEDSEKTEYIPGEHTLNFDYNYSQIITALTSKYANREIKRVTIPEGYTVDQIIDLLLENGIGERDKYIEAINEYPYKWEFVQLLGETGYSEHRKYRLEGYLYPDTYEFYTTESEVLVINKMLNAFNNKFWKEFNTKNANGESHRDMVMEEYGMTFDDIVVLASMVQSEGGTAEDFYFISYVFHNRLSHSSSFPKLESDATIQYALPERITDSSQIDISYDTRYNTYLYNGLPPGAISNPGLDALTATIFPTAPTSSSGSKINAYFFVSNDAGKTYYASTKSGHATNKEQVKKDNAAIEAGKYEG